MNRYIILYNETTIGEANTYNEALIIATRYGNGAFENIIIVDKNTAEVITKLNPQ